MRNKIIILLIILATSTLVLIFSRRSGNADLISANLANLQIKPSPTVQPTPTPIIFDKNSNLKSELEKLIPSDFSLDFNFLKEEASKF